MPVTQYTDYTWKTIPYEIATLNIPITDLAKKLGMTTVRYDDEGFGMATAFLCELEDGLIIGVEELDHIIDTESESQTLIYVESYELRKQSVEKLIQRCLDGFGLDFMNVNWQVKQTVVEDFLVINPNYTNLGINI